MSLLLEAVLSKHGKKVFNYIYRMVNNREDAEDIYQAVFTLLNKKLSSIKEDAVPAYLFKIAYTQTVNYRKKRNKRHDFETSLEKPIIENTSNLQNRKNMIITKAIAQLPISQASVIDLKVYQNKSYKEISAIMDISESAVESFLVRARKKLFILISQEMRGDDVLINERRI